MATQAKITIEQDGKFIRCRMVCEGNPTRGGGEFYNNWKVSKPSGETSITVNDALKRAYERLEVLEGMNQPVELSIITELIGAYKLAHRALCYLDFHKRITYGIKEA